MNKLIDLLKFPFFFFYGYNKYFYFCVLRLMESSHKNWQLYVCSSLWLQYFFLLFLFLHLNTHVTPLQVSSRISRKYKVKSLIVLAFFSVLLENTLPICWALDSTWRLYHELLWSDSCRSGPLIWALLKQAKLVYCKSPFPSS